MAFLTNISIMLLEPNCQEVYPRLFIGNRLAANDRALLERYGITALLSLHPPDLSHQVTIEFLLFDLYYIIIL